MRCHKRVALRRPEQRRDFVRSVPLCADGASLLHAAWPSSPKLQTAEYRVCEVLSLDRLPLLSVMVAVVLVLVLMLVVLMVLMLVVISPSASLGAL